MLLEYTQMQLPGVRLILGEPFVLPCGVVEPAWQEEMAARQAVVRRLAEEFGATFVAYQAAFDQVAGAPAPDYWLVDGVHPSPAGHKLMAGAWLDAVTPGE
jgi:lysophospholipase L1-like esterase